MRVLVTGATGRLGSYVMRRLALRPHDVVGWARTGRTPTVSNRFQIIDLTDAAGFDRVIRAVDPELVIHLAAISSADEVRRDPRTAWEINVEATGRLVTWAIANDRRLVFTSTDLVFDGTRSWYREDDPPRPILEYGRLKRAAELLVAASSQSLTVRISLLYGNCAPGQGGLL